MTPKQRQLVLSLMSDHVVGIEPTEHEGLVCLRFEKRSLVGGVTSHLSRPVTREFAEEVMRLREDSSR